MKRIAALICILALAGCVNHLPKPTNANGSINPSVAVAEAKITYTNATNDAATYTRACHPAPPATPPIGCDEHLIAQLKSQSTITLNAINAAEQAVRTLPQGATGIDAAIGKMNAALSFLQNILNAAKHYTPTSMLQNLNVLDGVVA